MAKSEDTETTSAPKKKGGFMKIIIMVVILLLVAGGGVAGGLYAMQSGLIGGSHAAAEAVVHYDKPKLVPKSDEKRGGPNNEEHGGGGVVSGSHTPMGAGADKYASTYFSFDKEFTSNLRESVHFIQVGIAVSTPYDERVIDNIKTHEIAVRSAILLALGDANEEQVFAVEGKEKLQSHLVHAINDVLRQKEGFGGVSNVYFTNFVVQ